MQSFLIISQNKDFIDTKIKKLTKNLRLSSLDIFDHTPETSLGIDLVRTLELDTKNLPFAGGDRLVILRDFQLATTEAQNALLKLLEEPQKKMVVILISDSLKNLLPTVISRCQLIKENKKISKITDDQKPIHKTLSTLLTASTQERLSFAQNNINSKEEATRFINNLLNLLQQFLTDRTLHKSTSTLAPLKPKQVSRLIKKTEAAGRFIEGNTNFRLVIDVLLLGLPDFT